MLTSTASIISVPGTGNNWDSRQALCNDLTIISGLPRSKSQGFVVECCGCSDRRSRLMGFTLLNFWYLWSKGMNQRRSPIAWGGKVTSSLSWNRFRKTSSLSTHVNPTTTSAAFWPSPWPPSVLGSSLHGFQLLAPDGLLSDMDTGRMSAGRHVAKRVTRIGHSQPN